MKIKTTLTTLCMVVALAVTAPITSNAAEFTVTDATAVLYTNDTTVLLSDADVNKVFMPLQAGLPVLVTGVTSNGYFRVDIAGAVYYVVGTGLTAPAATTSAPAASSTGWTQESVYTALMSLKATKYPQGSPWGADKRDYCKERWQDGRIYDFGGYGGLAFAARVMKDIFGENVIIQHKHTYDVSPLKVGDIIDYDDGGGDNSYVITAIDDKYITAVDGSVHYDYQTALEGWVNWNEKIPITDLIKDWEPNAIPYFSAY